MNQWEKNAERLERVYGIYVAWDEPKGDCYYICPFCGEPVYECDWTDTELNEFDCPICEDDDNEELEELED